MPGRLQIVYHGTNRETAAIIRKEGFKKNTYFATHLEDAVGFGGAYVFEVMYPSDQVPREAWQFIITKPISPKAIIRLKVYKVSTIFEEQARGNKVFESNMSATEENLTLAISKMEAEDQDQGEDRI